MTRFAMIAVAAILCTGCGKQRPDRTRADRTADQSAEPKPFDLRRNMNLIYEAAVRDFAEYEMAHRNPKWPPRTFRLDHGPEEIDVWDEGGITTINLSPDQLNGIDFKTALGGRLLNPDDPFPDRAENPVRTIRVFQTWYSESRRRVQICLGWRDTISESWTFLYDITDDGSLQLKKLIMLGCNSPDGWIDGP
jgi:hypothetical protein